MKTNALTRREFLVRSAALAGAAWATPSLVHAAAEKRTATVIVTLGKTGIKLSRLGIGTGAA